MGPTSEGETADQGCVGKETGGQGTDYWAGRDQEGQCGRSESEGERVESSIIVIETFVIQFYVYFVQYETRGGTAEM